MKIKPGTKVLVTKDIREGGKASGQVGVYEGDFPLSVVFGYGETADSDVVWVDGEYLYEDYKKASAAIDGVTLSDGSLIELHQSKPLNEVFIEWERGKPRPVPFFAMPMMNPRIRLEDGSVIWGAECWWEEYTEGLTQAQSEEHLEQHLEVLRGIADAITHRKDVGDNERSE